MIENIAKDIKKELKLIDIELTRYKNKYEVLLNNDLNEYQSVINKINKEIDNEFENIKKHESVSKPKNYFINVNNNNNFNKNENLLIKNAIKLILGEKLKSIKDSKEAIDNLRKHVRIVEEKKIKATELMPYKFLLKKEEKIQFLFESLNNIKIEFEFDDPHQQIQLLTFAQKKKIKRQITKIIKRFMN